MLADSSDATSLLVAPLCEARHCAALREFGAYGVARVLRSAASGAWPSGDRLIAPSGAAQAHGGEWLVDAADCLRLPASLDEHAALALPPLMAALGCWAQLRLELGEVAAVSGATPLAGLLRLTAYWQGAMPVIALGGDAQALDNCVSVAVDDAQLAVARLQQLQGSIPGFAAVDVSGRAWSADILFQALPRWGRLRLGGVTLDSLTVDFYKDVHVKGARVLTAPFTLAALLGDRAALPALHRRAVRLLERTATGAAVKAVLGL